MSLLPENGGDVSAGINAVMAPLLSTWQAVESIRLQNKLANAAIRAGDLESAAQYSNQQALDTRNAAPPAGIPAGVLLLGGGLLLVLLLGKKG